MPKVEQSIVILDADSSENGSAATAGDVIAFDEASDTYGANTLASINQRLGACVGRALTSGAARTSATVFDIVKVRMRGF